ncbi:alpha/beta fold hydrolase [Desulfatibacillum aliphaticivorans]|nr:alpha/beta hydrolase [Desulfatibacillum aliphaticivorans]
MPEPVMKKVKGDGVNINLAIWEGGGKPILCIHGITANCRCWDVFAGLLAPARQVMAMDLRGRGYSDKPDHGYSMDYHTKDIKCLLDDLGFEKAVIMGHSLGAFIGLAFAAEYPEYTDRLVLVDGGGDLSPEQFEEVFKGIKPALDRLGQIFDSEEAYMEKMKAAPYLHPWSEAIETYCRHELEAADGGVRTNIDAAHIAEEAANVRLLQCADYYGKVQCPVLILRATEGLLSDKDLLLPEDVADRMTRQIPDAEMFEVEGVNHYGIVFQPHPARDAALKGFLEMEGS